MVGNLTSAVMVFFRGRGDYNCDCYILIILRSIFFLIKIAKKLLLVHFTAWLNSSMIQIFINKAGTHCLFSIIIENDYTVIIETMAIYFNLSLWALLHNVFYLSFKNVWNRELILIYKNELWNCETLLQSEKALYQDFRTDHIR